MKCLIIQCIVYILVPGEDSHSCYVMLIITCSPIAEGDLKAAAFTLHGNTARGGRAYLNHAMLPNSVKMFFKMIYSDFTGVHHNETQAVEPICNKGILKALSPTESTCALLGGFVMGKKSSHKKSNFNNK